MRNTRRQEVHTPDRGRKGLGLSGDQMEMSPTIQSRGLEGPLPPCLWACPLAWPPGRCLAKQKTWPPHDL